ncbi:MAG: prolipoprotein diacylglyceryl transferase [Myxococcota bacterium]
MMPYVQFYDLHLGPLPVHPFGLLVALGITVGVQLARRRARVVGIPQHELTSFIAWMLVGGFVGGHVLDTFFYHPHDLRENPWSLLFLWSGLSSFGGFAGGLLGALLWKFYELAPVFRVGRWLTVVLPRRRREARLILPHCDAILAVFPCAWVFGRLGCTIVHDHPGVTAPSWMPLAVAYGPGPVKSLGIFELRYGGTARYDLGLLEMVFSLAVAAIFAGTWKKSLPLGWYVAVLPIVYAPTRFALDFLRLDDPAGGDVRYAALTPAQWACVALLCVGLYQLARLPPRAAQS